VNENRLGAVVLSRMWLQERGLEWIKSIYADHKNIEFLFGTPGS
jgi:hypothetical protein